MKTKLQVERLESRELPATGLTASATLQQPVTTQKPIQVVLEMVRPHQVSKVIMDTSSWKMGLRINHNETLIRDRRRSRGKR